MTTQTLLRDPVTGPELHGLARMGAHFVAVPIAGIREVVPHPPRLAALPATLPQMRGGLELRGALVPVIDLAALLGCDDTRSSEGDQDASEAAAKASYENASVIMILRTAKGVFGVCVDQICGVVDLARQHQTALDLVPDGLTAIGGMVGSGFSVNGHTGVVLNVDGMTALPGLILAEDRLVADVARSTAGPPVLTFAVGGFRFGLCTDAIEATLPRGPVLSSPVEDPVWIGRIETNGSRLPLIDTLTLLGLGACPQQRESASVVVRLANGGRVALCIDAVIDMVRLAPEDLLGMQGFALGEGGMIAGLQGSASPILMLDAAAMATNPQLVNLAGLAEREDGSDIIGSKPSFDDPERPALAAAASAPQPFLIFMMGDDQHAAPLDQVTEILPFDASRMIDLGSTTGPFRAMIAHRGASVPIIDLGNGVAEPAAEIALAEGEAPSRFILIAASAQRSAGFLLDGLCAVERHTMRPIARSNEGALSAGDFAGMPGPVIRTRDGRTCAVHNLASVIERAHCTSLKEPLPELIGR